MKFEYDGSDIERKGGCVAFIDIDGDLWMGVQSGCCDEIKSVLFDFSYGTINAGSISIEEGICEYGSKRKFYPGDKITITF